MAPSTVGILLERPWQYITACWSHKYKEDKSNNKHLHCWYENKVNDFKFLFVEWDVATSLAIVQWIAIPFKSEVSSPF